MPSPREHGQIIKKWENFLENFSKDEFPEVYVIGSFYSCLHMLEATAFTFPGYFGNNKHFESHGARLMFFQSMVFEFKHPFYSVFSSYKSLQGLSESARYLSQACLFQYDPLKPGDQNKAKHFHDSIKFIFEKFFLDNNKEIPWK